MGSKHNIVYLNQTSVIPQTLQAPGSGRNEAQVSIFVILWPRPPPAGADPGVLKAGGGGGGRPQYENAQMCVSRI